MTRLLWAIVALGIFLRSLQYFANVSLFIDEALIALNLRDLSYPQLMRGALFGYQVAPPGYLVIAKFLGQLFNYHEYAIRLPAFLSSIGALILFVEVAKKTLRGIAVPLAVLLMATAPALIKYGAEVKQYSSDLLATLVLLYSAISLVQSGYSRRWVILVSIAGMAMVALSFTAIISAAGIGLALLIIAAVQRNRRGMVAVGIIGAVWGGSALLALLVVLKGSAAGTIAYMYKSWASSIPSLFNPAKLLRPLWIIRGLYWNGIGLWAVATAAMAAALIGLHSFRRRRWETGLVIISPLVMLLIVSYSGRYPFSNRLILFIYPIIILVLAEGVGFVVEALSAKPVWVRAIPVALFAIPPFIVHGRLPPPWFNEEMKPVLAHVTANRQPGDRILVNAGASPAMHYYAPRFQLDSSEWIDGSYTVERDTSAYWLADLTRLEGARRAWLIFSHDDVYPRMRARMVSELRKSGAMIDSVAFPEKPQGSGSKAYLFDLRLEPDG